MAEPLSDKAVEELKGLSGRILEATPWTEYLSVGLQLKNIQNSLEDEKSLPGKRDALIETINKNPARAVRNIETAMAKDSNLLDRLEKNPALIADIVMPEPAAAISLKDNFANKAAPQPPAPQPPAAISLKDDFANKAAPKPPAPQPPAAAPEGFKEFTENLINNPALQEAFEGIFSAEGGGDFSKIQNVVAKDPDFFKTLNTVIEQEGFNDFLEAAGKHEGLRTVLADTLGSAGDEPEKASQFLDAIHQGAESDPEFFQTLSRLIDENPKMIDKTIENMGDDPSGTFKNMGKFTKLAGGMYAFLDSMNSINPGFGGFLKQLMGILAEFIPDIQKYIEPLEKLSESLENIASESKNTSAFSNAAQGKEQTPSPAATAGTQRTNAATAVPAGQ